MTTQTFYRLYRSRDGGNTWRCDGLNLSEGVAQYAYDQQRVTWIAWAPQRCVKLVRVTVTETEEIVASTEAAV